MSRVGSIVMPMSSREMCRESSPRLMVSWITPRFGVLHISINSLLSGIRTDDKGSETRLDRLLFDIKAFDK